MAAPATTDNPDTSGRDGGWRVKADTIVCDNRFADRSAARIAFDAEPDVRCVERTLRGEPGAFGRLYQRHVEGVYNFVHFRVRDDRVAEDLTQDVFVNALRGLPQLRDPARFRPWLLRIAHHRVLNHWRARSGAPDEVELPADDDPATSPPGLLAAAADGPLASLERRLDADDIAAALGTLTDLQKQVVALRFIAGLSVAETADAMDRSVSAVKNLQHHALHALRRRLGAVPPRVDA